MKFERKSNFKCPHCKESISVLTEISDCEPKNVSGDNVEQNNDYRLNVDITVLK